MLAIDNSLSMRAGDRLDQAKQAAKSVIGGLRPGERAQVLAFGSRVQVMSEVTDDHAPLNAGIDAIEASRRPHVVRANSRARCAPSRNRSTCRCTCTSIPTCSRPACRRISTTCA